MIIIVCVSLNIIRYLVLLVVLTLLYQIHYVVKNKAVVT